MAARMCELFFDPTNPCRDPCEEYDNPAKNSPIITPTYKAVLHIKTLDYNNIRQPREAAFNFNLVQ